MKSAEEIFDGEEPEVKAEEPTGEVDTVDAETDTTDVVDTEKAPEDTQTEETTDAPPASEEKPTVPLSALEDERGKRQSLGKENDELRAQLAESTKAEPTSVFADEAKFRDEIQTDFKIELDNQRFNQSEVFVADKIGRDVLDKKVAIYKDLSKDNADLKSRVQSAISPYHELVTIVDQHDEMSKMEDLPGYKAKLKAEARAEVLAEIEKKTNDKAELQDSVPDSLVDEAGKGALNSKPTSFTMKPIEDIVDTPR